MRAITRIVAPAVAALLIAGAIGTVVVSPSHAQPAVLSGVPTCRVAKGTAPATSSLPATFLRDGAGRPIVVPVCVDGYGPFRFLVDTGASRSAVDRSLAARLHLRNAGGASTARGAACSVTARPVRVAAWSVGPLGLAGQSLLSTDLGRLVRTGVVGVVGSDVWSRFRAERFDYASRRLTVLGRELSPSGAPGIFSYSPPKLPGGLFTSSGMRAVPLSVLEAGGAAFAVLQTHFGEYHEAFAVDTGASFSAVAKTALRDIAVHPTGRSISLGSAGCDYQASLYTTGPWTIGGEAPFDRSTSPNVDEIQLAGLTLAAVPLPQAGGRLSLQGLFGSDALSRFGSVVLDYPDAALLVPGGSTR